MRPECGFWIASDWPEIGKETMTSQFPDITSLPNFFDAVLFLFLSAWLVSMEICPQGISIFIWHSLLKSKSTKRTQGQSLRPKRRIQNLVKRLRWSFLRKYLRTFSYKLLSLLSKLLYTEAYPEPSGTSKMDFLATTLNGFQLLTIVFIA